MLFAYVTLTLISDFTHKTGPDILRMCLGQGFQTLEPEDRHTDTTERITAPHWQLIKR